MFPLLWGQRLEQSQIGFAQRAKLLNRLAGIPLLVMQGGHPGILIESRDGSARCAQNQPQTKPNRDFRIGQVCRDLAD